MNRTSSTLIVLTFVGMVGLYVAAYIAWQRYKEKTAPGTVGGLLTSIGS